MSAGTQLINSANQANKSNRNPSSHQQLGASVQALDEQIPDLVQALRTVQKNRDSATAQLALINASQEFIQVFILAFDLIVTRNVCLSLLILKRMNATVVTGQKDLVLYLFYVCSRLLVW